jgi:hypothetical protein
MYVASRFLTLSGAACLAIVVLSLALRQHLLDKLDPAL